MATSERRSIAITGCGWVTPFAAGSVADVLSAASQDHRAPAGAAYWAVPDERLAAWSGLSTEITREHGAWVAGAALAQACHDAGTTLSAFPAERVGLVLGCGFAGQLGMIGFANEVRAQSPRFVSPIHFPQTVGNYFAGALARGFDIRGPNLTLASGIASSLDALAEALRILGSGRADVVLAGGVEVLSDSLSLGLGETETPWSEGACLFVLERCEDADRRGRALLGILADGATDPALDKAALLRSTAGFREEGAVHIEHAIGRCVGAAGAAAVAAAIGAATGLKVPIVNRDGEVAWQHIPVAAGCESTKAVPATVEARYAECQRTLPFTIPGSTQP